MLSIIIPSRPSESKWLPLLEQLGRAVPPSEVILSMAAPLERREEEALEKLRSPHAVRVEVGRAGRGSQLNHGAAVARNENLWFLHADSRLTADTWSCLEESLRRRADCIHFSRLRFYDGGAIMGITELGANFRSKLLGLPFGDQGMCLRRDTLARCGGFDEQLSYGEDHVLIWRARKLGIPVLCTGGTLATSASKYIERGWLQVTLEHGYRTWLQAFGESVRRPRVS